MISIEIHRRPRRDDEHGKQDNPVGGIAQAPERGIQTEADQRKHDDAKMPRAGQVLVREDARLLSRGNEPEEWVETLQVGLSVAGELGGQREILDPVRADGGQVLNEGSRMQVAKLQERKGQDGQQRQGAQPDSAMESVILEIADQQAGAQQGNQSVHVRVRVERQRPGQHGQGQSAAGNGSGSACRPGGRRHTRRRTPPRRRRCGCIGTTSEC